MNKDEYQKLVKKHTPREDKLHNTVYAFLIGGFVWFNKSSSKHMDMFNCNI